MAALRRLQFFAGWNQSSSSCRFLHGGMIVVHNCNWNDGSDGDAGAPQHLSFFPSRVFTTWWCLKTMLQRDQARKQVYKQAYLQHSSPTTRFRAEPSIKGAPNRPRGERETQTTAAEDGCRRRRRCRDDIKDSSLKGNHGKVASCLLPISRILPTRWWLQWFGVLKPKKSRPDALSLSLSPSIQGSTMSLHHSLFTFQWCNKLQPQIRARQTLNDFLLLITYLRLFGLCYIFPLLIARMIVMSC